MKISQTFVAFSEHMNFMYFALRSTVTLHIRAFDLTVVCKILPSRKLVAAKKNAKIANVLYEIYFISLVSGHSITTWMK